MDFIWRHMLLGMLLVSSCGGGENINAPGILVSSEWVENQLDNPSMVMLHLGTREGYDSIHIPGARHIEINDFMLATDSLRNELPSLTVIGELLRSVGVNSDSRIVIYYEGAELVSRAARLFLALDHAGLGDRTYVLNGGLPLWMKKGLEVTEEVTSFLPGDFEITKPREVVIKAHELNRHRWDPDYVIVDSRSRDEYYGELDSTGNQASGGHIEGAYFLSYEAMLSDTAPYLFLKEEALLKQFNNLGVDHTKKAVYYCGSGVRASVNYMVARHFGYPAMLYDGSIQEWEELDLPQTSPVIEPPNN